MTSVYRPYIGTTFSTGRIAYWVEEATEEKIADRVFVRVLNTLRDDRDAWHETRTAAMDEAAVQIEQMARDLTKQARQIREQAARLRERSREDDERYDRGLPPRIEVES